MQLSKDWFDGQWDMLPIDTKKRIVAEKQEAMMEKKEEMKEEWTEEMDDMDMDDMDMEAEELGGKPSFFTGDYAQYGWRKIFNTGMGGHDMVQLYGEAISIMPQNPNLPQLFRDIFKNAFLPFTLH